MEWGLPATPAGSDRQRPAPPLRGSVIAGSAASAAVRAKPAQGAALSERSGVAAAPMARGYPAAAVSALSSKVPATPAIGNGPITSRDRANTGRRDPAAAHASALQGREQGESRRTVAAHSRAAVRRARILTDAARRDLQRRAERVHATPLPAGSRVPHRCRANASPLGRRGDGDGEAVCRNRPACALVRHKRTAAAPWAAEAEPAT